MFADAAVVDVGMGECPWTTLDLARAVRSVQRGLRVVGVEVDARRALAAKEIAGAEIDVRVGGFALAVVEQWRVVRAVNVLRQYSPGEVSIAHAALSEGLVPGGVILEGTSSKRGDSFAVLVLRRMATGLAREALVFHCAGVRGFAPILLRDVLPRDLRRGVVPGTRLHELFSEWTRAWQRVRSDDPSRSFADSAFELAGRMPDVEADAWLVARGLCVWRPPGGVPALKDWQPD